MRLFKFFQYNEKVENRILLVVDVQKSFKKFFTDNYVSAIENYTKEFKKVYYIWDNHSKGKDVGTDYLYKANVKSNTTDLYSFNNVTEYIEKRYNYDVNADYYKNIVDSSTLDAMSGKLKRGDLFKTKFGTYIVYVGNNHRFFHIPKKLADMVEENKLSEIEVIGGSSNECLLDVCVAIRALGGKVKTNYDYIYSGSNCPIK